MIQAYSAYEESAEGPDHVYDANRKRFIEKAKELACSTCPMASRRRARFKVRRPPTPDLPLFTWAKVPLP